MDAAAQRPPPPTRPSAGSTTGERWSGTIVVNVRDVRGGLITAGALVRLYSDFTSVRQTEATQDSGRATFRRIPMGNYRVEVSALGYQTASEEVLLGPTNYVFIFLQPESPVETAPNPPGPPILAPKARKELQKGLKALEANELKKARKRLLRAFKLAPGHPDVNYLLGVLYLRLNDLAQAKRHLEKAVTLYPDHVAALTTLGALLYHQRDDPAAIRALQQALGLKPNAWQTHWTLARACYRQRQFAKARTHAERALALAQGKAPAIQVLLGQTLLALGEREKAVQEIESFLRRHPEHPTAAGARRLLDQLRAQRAETAPATPHPPSTELAAMPSVATAPIAPALPVRNWAPPPVHDEDVPSVAPDVACALPQVLTAASRRVAALVENLQKFTALERIEYARLDEAGNIRSQQVEAFNYIVSIYEVRTGRLAVQEFRQGRAAWAVTPTRTRGLAALALIFHPYYVEDFTMRCEGLGQWHGQPVWQLYFQQREDRPARIYMYRSNQGSFPIKLKGRAWIAANNYHIVRLVMDMVEPIKKINLARQHLIVEYQPVDFAERNVKLWLPARADVYMQLRGRRYRHQHSFSNFMLFAVEVDERIQTPFSPNHQPRF
ncbi:MAG: tetratricopeptide repeat protein [Terriglobia bacterium]